MGQADRQTERRQSEIVSDMMKYGGGTLIQLAYVVSRGRVSEITNELTVHL
jgi:hypothetical protein